jgi:hypothetical protein
MIRARANAMVHAARLEIRMRRAREREHAALARAGEWLAKSEHHPVEGPYQPLLSDIQRHRGQLAAQSVALAGSLELDRADYLAVASWIRPVVIVRGLCARAVLRHRVVRSHRELRPLYQRLAAVALEESSNASHRFQPTPSLAEAVRSARAEMASVAAERTLRLAPSGGRVWPAWAGAVADEGKAFGRALIKQMHGQLLPRASALAGLAAGWWVTHTYTDSRPRSVLRSLGIGSGGTHVVSGDTYRTMRFWLPILAAAILAYLGDRIARWVQQRYQPQDVSARVT